MTFTRRSLAAALPAFSSLPRLRPRARPPGPTGRCASSCPSPAGRAPISRGGYFPSTWRARWASRWWWTTGRGGRQYRHRRHRQGDRRASHRPVDQRPALDRAGAVSEPALRPGQGPDRGVAAGARAAVPGREQRPAGHRPEWLPRACAGQSGPGRLRLGGVGSGGHLGMLDLLARTGAPEMLHVAYRGFPRRRSTVAGAHPGDDGDDRGGAAAGAGGADPRHRGDLRARFAPTPAVPTLAEQGLANADPMAGRSWWCRSSTPADRVARLAAEAQRGPARRRRAGAARGRGVRGDGHARRPRPPPSWPRRPARWGGMIRRLDIRLDN